MDIRNDAAGFVLDELVTLGSKRLKTSTKATELVNTIKEKFNYDCTGKDTAQQVLAAIRTPLLDALDEFAKRTGEAAIEAIEAMEPHTAKRTFLQCYGELGGQAKFVVWLLTIFCVITTCLFNYNVYVLGTGNTDMQMLGLLVPFATLVGLCVLPVKTVAYAAMTLGSHAISSKLKK